MLDAKRTGLVLYAAGAAMFVGGVFGIGGAAFWGTTYGSLPLAVAGAVILLVGLGALVWASRHTTVARPHVLVLVVTAIAIALHAHESLPGLSLGFFLWPLVPYALCLIVAALSKSSIPAGAGAVTALIFDLDAHYVVFIHPTSSTAGLALFFVPLWNLLVYSPAAMLIAYLILRPKCRVHSNAP
jgi:hypothetical protein